MCRCADLSESQLEEELEVAVIKGELTEEKRRYLLERAKQSAHTSHLTTSEQEETSSFVITGS